MNDLGICKYCKHWQRVLRFTRDGTGYGCKLAWESCDEDGNRSHSRAECIHDPEAPTQSKFEPRDITSIEKNIERERYLERENIALKSKVERLEAFIVKIGGGPG